MVLVIIITMKMSHLTWHFYCCAILPFLQVLLAHDPIFSFSLFQVTFYFSLFVSCCLIPDPLSRVFCGPSLVWEFLGISLWYTIMPPHPPGFLSSYSAELYHTCVKFYIGPHPLCRRLNKTFNYQLSPPQEFHEWCVLFTLASYGLPFP